MTRLRDHRGEVLEQELRDGETKNSPESDSTRQAKEHKFLTPYFSNASLRIPSLQIPNNGTSGCYKSLGLSS